VCLASLNPQVCPPIKKGASLLLAFRLENRPVLLIGGGVVASGRLFFLLEAGAHVTLVSPFPLDPSIARRLETNPGDITHVAREYRGREDEIKVDDFAMVLTAIDDVVLSREVCHMAREKHVPVNVADVPPECDFYFGAQFRRGPLQVMVSTQGMGPKIGAIVRDRLAEALPDDIEEAIEGVGELRKDLRRRAPGVGGELGKRRMEWMVKMCEAWPLAEMGRFRDADIRAKVLDDGWEKGLVVLPEDVGGAGVVQKAVWWAEALGSSIFRVGLGGLVGGAALGALGMYYYTRYSR
jgi:precorrin-2 dehydrogenase/sirohydrochlorin ferrochelatase